jgi:NIPSNAP
MDRRQFLGAAATGAISMNFPAQAADTKPALIELTWVRMRNTPDSMTQRTNDFLAKAYLPALQRAGAGQTGAFSNLYGEGSPSTLLVIEFPDAAAWESSAAKLRDDKEFTKAAGAYYAGPLQYVRKEVTLLRGFPSMPKVEAPTRPPEGKTHVFELRTYESNNQRTLARKVRMFDEGEISLFRKMGMKPVFFGEALAGGNLPQLTYLLAYDDMAAREKAWSAFVSSPEWDKMKNQPGVSDPEIVSNISNSILRPLPFSGIR